MSVNSNKAYRDRERFEFMKQLAVSLASGHGAINDKQAIEIIRSAIAMANRVFPENSNGDDSIHGDVDRD